MIEIGILVTAILIGYFVEWIMGARRKRRLVLTQAKSIVVPDSGARTGHLTDSSNEHTSR